MQLPFEEEKEILTEREENMKRRANYKHETIMDWYYSCKVKGAGHYWY